MKLIRTISIVCSAITIICLFLWAGYIAVPLAVTAILLALGFASGYAAIGLYGALGKARMQHAQVNLTKAQTYATILDAAKLPDNIAGVALPPAAGQVSITILPNRSNLQSNSVIQPNQPVLPAPAPAQSQELPPANFFDHVPANPYRNGELFFTLGVDLEGRAITRAAYKTNHYLEAGKTESGKSTFLRALAAQPLLAELDHPGRAQIALIDLTGITFNVELFKGLPQTFGGEVVHNAGDAIELIQMLLAECKRRSLLYARARGLPESLPEYNAVAPYQHQLPPVMVFIEEMSALADYAGQDFLSPLKQLIWQSRKFGIYLNQAGQDFRAKTIDKTITDNSSSRLLFGHVDDNTARVIGFEPKQHRISFDQPGRGLVMLRGQVQEFQGLYLPKGDFVDLVNQLRRRSGLNEVGGDGFDDLLKPYIASQPAQEARRSHEVFTHSDSGYDIVSHNAVDGSQKSQPATNDHGFGDPVMEKEESTNLALVVATWRSGANSVRKIAAALDLTFYQAQKLCQEAREQELID